MNQPSNKMCFAAATLLSVKEQRSARKRVMFAPENETIPIPSLITSSLSEQYEQSSHNNSWKSDLWYQPADLAGFREEVRNFCRRLRCPEQADQILLRPCDGSIRGLEQRLCPERKRRKYISNRCIIHASKKQCTNNAWDADRLAALCRKINEWSTELAVIEGARDFDRAWCEERKRLLTREIDQSRCVRQRVV